MSTASPTYPHVSGPHFSWPRRATRHLVAIGNGPAGANVSCHCAPSMSLCTWKGPAILESCSQAAQAVPEPGMCC